MQDGVLKHRRIEGQGHTWHDDRGYHVRGRTCYMLQGSRDEGVHGTRIEGRAHTRDKGVHGTRIKEGVHDKHRDEKDSIESMVESS